MNIQFYAKNVDLTERIKDYVQEKIGALDKYGLNFSSVRVDISKDSRHQKGDVFRFEANMTILGNKMIRAEARAGDIMSSVEIVRDKLETQITKIKDKIKR
ncbi:MAG TPA: ribosome-associated translation inhibitor RaiA [bacterium]|jgi:putative sigma-54 modulation protein|nr:ribosome-associated translation inhibitor RaiA [bacterium]HOG38220.1 ribosome-associated translation inhibitor RaiA [bacterium]HQI03190.1 ribosome-associated translation inhibitor RaiA [bacterium]